MPQDRVAAGTDNVHSSPGPLSTGKGLKYQIILFTLKFFPLGIKNNQNKYRNLFSRANHQMMSLSRLGGGPAGPGGISPSRGRGGPRSPGQPRPWFTPSSPTSPGAKPRSNCSWATGVS